MTIFFQKQKKLVQWVIFHLPLCTCIPVVIIIDGHQFIPPLPIKNAWSTVNLNKVQSKKSCLHLFKMWLFVILNDQKENNKIHLHVKKNMQFGLNNL